ASWGMPHLVTLSWVNLTHLLSAFAYALTSLHISSRLACFSPPARAAMAFFSTSARCALNLPRQACCVAGSICGTPSGGLPMPGAPMPGAPMPGLPIATPGGGAAVACAGAPPPGHGAVLCACGGGSVGHGRVCACAVTTATAIVVSATPRADLRLMMSTPREA